MKYFILLLSLFLTLDNAFANFTLNVGLIHKKGGDKGTPLVNEIYSSENVYHDEFIIIKMRDEIILKVQAYFSPEENVYGPSQKITIKGTVSSTTLQEEKEVILSVPLGATVNKIYEFTDKRIVELNFHPVL